jgi:murein L,D-transpeptidase YcbB/YkuD
MSTARLAVPALLLGLVAARPAAAQSPMEIVVNIAAGRLDVIRDGQRVRSYPVSVGMPRYATPTGSADIRRMVWNPSWTPPDAEWARNEKPASPGWGNPMGRVKMHLFDDYYIHGTPRGNESRLGRPASHGCIRMRNQDAMELAQMVLRADGAPVAEGTVQSLIRNPGTTRELALRGRVHVRVEYRLAEVDDYSVTLLPDVYARSGPGYHQAVGEELQRQGTVMDPMLANLRVSGSALRFGRMDITRPARLEVPGVSPAERIVARATAPSPSRLASNSAPAM